jgi:hypothetical protein
MKTKTSFTKIKVNGHIQVGFKHELQQATRAGLAGSFASRQIDSGGVTKRPDYDPISPENSNTLGQILEFKFSPQSIGELFIEGDGLVTSYGIFGAPGSGKTVLLMHLLKQVLGHSVTEPNKRYGALILDPKAALIEDITKIAEETGRINDLDVISTDYLIDKKEKINIIDCSLDPYELGSILVLAGRSAGIDASDPFWFQEWSNLFASTISLLRTEAWLNMSISGPVPVSLGQLIDALFEEVEPGERVIQRLARTLSSHLNQLPIDKRHDVLVDIRQIERFYRQDYVGTIEAFITKAFGMFRRWRYQCYSDNTPRLGRPPFYEDIIENGRIVLVSISPAEPVLAKTLCTLIKCLFQRTVLSRGQNSTISNNERPLVIACDEYSEIASEVPGQSMGDGQFLALARQYGCMVIFATQSVNVLQASSLKDTWRSVFSNFAAKFYMRLVDNETAEEATKLAGEADWKVVVKGTSVGRDGLGASTQTNLQVRKNLPPTILTQVLKRGQAVVIGSLDAGSSIPGTYFLSVPPPPEK